MASVFDVLGQDHREVRTILDQLEQSPGATAGATDDQLGPRAELVERLVIEESRHEAAEEEYFWPAVREHVPDGNALAEKAIAQEDEGKKVLDSLRKTGPKETEFDSLVTRFVKEGREHMAFEETEVWPQLDKVRTAEQLDELGMQIEQAKKNAPTRPHPHTPSSPTALKTAGAGVAMADKARDAATGRGKH